MHQSGQPNLIDLGVLARAVKSLDEAAVEAEWAMVDELPFDFNRRRMSVIVKPTPADDTPLLLVCKVRGASLAPNLFTYSYSPPPPH